MRRAAPALAVLALTLAGPRPAVGQEEAPAAPRALPPTPEAEEEGAPLVVEQRAERVTWVTRAPTSAAPGLGGAAGAGAARAGGAAWHEDVVVVQSGPHEDARLVVAVEKDGRTTTFDVRADQLVAFVGVGGLDAGAARPRAVWAEGHVRVVVEAPQGQLLVEAEAAWFDLSRTRAALRGCEVRGERARPRDAPPPAPGDLSAATVVLRAARLRALGPGQLVAEQATLSPCDLGEPHVALTVDRLEATAVRPAAGGLRKRPAGPGDDVAPTSSAAPLGGPGPGPIKGPGRAATEAPLLEALLGGRGAPGAGRGSDALRREGQVPRWLDLEGVGLALVAPVGEAPRVDLPLLPFGSWRSDWPVPRVRVGDSSRLGLFGIVELGHGLGTYEHADLGRLELEARERVEYYADRGTGGELGLGWRHTVGRERRGTGFLRAFALEDRADFDRVGTPVETEHRHWLRGLVSERLPAGVQVDAEVSKLSDRGLLLEFFRSTAQAEKEQETYVYGRWARDALSLRGIGRVRLNDFQTQVEQLPEAKLDLVLQPLLVDPLLGGVYLDVAGRAGVLRRRPDDDLVGARSWEAGRADVQGTLTWRRSFGPLEARAWGGARETGWTQRLGPGGDADDPAIDRFAASGGWNLATTLWRTFHAPWGGVLRHEVVPEAGTRHVFHVTRDPAELLAFDEVEDLRPTDHVFLRLRTRLLTDVEARRRKVVDLSVEARYFLTGQPGQPARSWSTIAWDLRLDPATWLTLRWRGELDPNRGEVAAFDVSARSRIQDLALGVSYRDVPDLVRAVSWSADWQLTPAWSVGVAEQYDLLTREFLAHRGRVVRRFHCVAVEVSLVYNPLQDDLAVSAAVALTPFGEEGPFERDRERDLY